MTTIGSLNIEGRESRRFRQVNCDIERSVPTPCDWGCSSFVLYSDALGAIYNRITS